MAVPLEFAVDWHRQGLLDLFDEGRLHERSAAPSCHPYELLQRRVELPHLADERLTVGVLAKGDW